MFKIIEIETTHKADGVNYNNYTIELTQTANNNNVTNCKIYYNVSESNLSLKTSFNGTFKTVKKLLNNYIKTELIGDIKAVTEY